jgi:hypothetical protein
MSTEDPVRLPKMGEMNNKSVQTSTRILREDPILRKEAIERLRSSPLEFVNECFNGC